MPASCVALRALVFSCAGCAAAGAHCFNPRPSHTWLAHARAHLLLHTIPSSCATGSGQCELDPVMGLVEPPMAATLELQRLRSFDQVRPNGWPAQHACPGIWHARALFARTHTLSARLPPSPPPCAAPLLPPGVLQLLPQPPVAHLLGQRAQEPHQPGAQARLPQVGGHSCRCACCACCACCFSCAY